MMKTMRSVLSAALTTVAMTVTMVAAVSCGGGDDSAGDAGEDGAATTTTAAATADSAATTTSRFSSATAPMPSVGASDFKFQPATVPRGVIVRLANGDSVAHTVESTTNAWTFDEASQTFTAPSAPGSYPFICGIHTSMTGTLTVS